MFQLDEQSQMVGGVIRQWCQGTLAPRIPALAHSPPVAAGILVNDPDRGQLPG